MEPFEGYSDEPVLNIRAVTQQTDIDPATLRAWERRYKVPKPKRDVQGHRLYSERDIMILRWLKSKVDASVRIKQAVELLSLHNPQALEDTPSVPKSRPISLEDTNRFDDLLDNFVEAIQEFDHAQAQHLITHALSIFSVESVCTEFLMPAMARIGLGWEQGDITLQMEHFASGLIRERLQAILASSPPPTRDGSLVVGCAPQDWHELGALMLSLVMRRRGWEVVYLGQNVGLNGLYETLEQLQPRVVTLSVSRLPSVRYLPDVAEMLAHATHNSSIFTFAGRLFSILPKLASQLPGIYLGSDLLQAVQQLQDLLQKPSNHQQQNGNGEARRTQAALDAFKSCRANLEGSATTHMIQLVNGVPGAQTTQAVNEIMEVLMVALRFDDSQVGEEMRQWAGASLPSYGVPINILPEFITHFKTTVKGCLPTSEAAVVNEFVEQLIAL